MIGWPRLRRWRAAGCVVFAALLLAGTAWFAARPVAARVRTHPYFRVGKMTIRGQGPRLHARDIRDWLGVRIESSLWDAEPGDVARRLRAHPLVAWASVKREFPNGLEIHVRERQPAALVLLDDLFFVDRGGALFGPVGPADSLDYPIITGIDEQTPVGYRRWALRRALRLLRQCQRQEFAGGVSEVHVDPKMGAIVYPARPRVPIVLGWGSTREKLRRAGQVLAGWGDGAHRLSSVDTRFLGQVVVKLRTPEEVAPGEGGSRRT